MPVAPPSVRVLPHLGTPREVFARIRGKSGAFLLESTARGDLGRWSFLGCATAATLEATESGACLTSGSTVLETWSDPFSALDELTSRYRPEDRPEGRSPPFQAGFIGYLGYDLARLIERIPTSATDDLRLPLMRLSLVDQVFCYDNRSGTWFETNTHLCDFDLVQRQDAWARTREALRQGPSVLQSFAAGPAHSRTGDERYLESVRRVLKLIAAGDVFQVNLSHRLEAPFAGDAFAYYSRLAELSPAPFAAYLEWPDLALAGCSPERFLRRNGSRVETRPIKGTSPRSEDPLIDAARRDSLRISAKDRAENLMIVDLLRNDLGRVARYGTVQVDELFRIEPHGPVWQMVSVISAELASEATVGGLLRATMPGGSMTGAPKVRAMEIIEELEPVRRGPYAGAVGYIDLSGDLDISITIRTAVIARGRIHLQVGGGIVADSTPEGELAETYAKATALRRALQPHDPTTVDQD